MIHFTRTVFTLLPLTLLLSHQQERQPDFYIYLRQQFKAPFGPDTRISKRDFGTIDYLGRTIDRTLNNYFYNASVKRISMGNVMPEKLGSARILRSGYRVEGGGRE
jgi:hypothetical protein